jgi:hypothetical protein
MTTPLFKPDPVIQHFDRDVDDHHRARVVPGRAGRSSVGRAECADCGRVVRARWVEAGRRTLPSGRERVSWRLEVEAE